MDANSYICGEPAVRTGCVYLFIGFCFLPLCFTIIAVKDVYAYVYVCVGVYILCVRIVFI